MTEDFRNPVEKAKRIKDVEHVGDGITHEIARKLNQTFITPLQTRKWTDKDGAEKYSTEIVIQKFRGELLLLDGKRESSPGQSASDLDDEIPF